LGVLGQDKGPTFAPVAYLSKKLDPTVRGWASCLRDLSAAYVLVQEAKKLTFGGQSQSSPPITWQNSSPTKA
jgi:hypothetical protein